MLVQTFSLLCFCSKVGFGGELKRLNNDEDLVLQQQDTILTMKTVVSWKERDALLSLYDAQNPRGAESTWGQTDVVRLRGDEFSPSKSPKNKVKNESVGSLE